MILKIPPLIAVALCSLMVVLAATSAVSSQAASHSDINNQIEATPEAPVVTVPLTDSVFQNPPTDQIILKYKASAGINAIAAAQPDRLLALSRAAGVALAYFREMSGDAHVLKLPERLPEEDVAKIAERLNTLPEVEYAEPDSVNTVGFTIPNDPRFSDQWHYSGTYGIRLPQAWDVTTGTNNIIVAVIDTGILSNHPDITGRLVPGYDLITDTAVANDGNGRDNNPSDPGDWVTVVESNTVNGPFYGCGFNNSTWHGTHVAGTIAANTNNGVGVSGITWQTRILPVRVLGKCGGYISNIADGIRWAAGLSVPGVPANTNPAQIINMSLGGIGACEATYQTAISAAINAKATVIVAAGNDNINATNQQPANCNGVLVVAATDDQADRAWFSNFGSIVDIAAPGVDVLSTGNSGTTSPGANAYTLKNGTSMATPHVAGVAALLLSLRPGFTSTQIMDILSATVTRFPSGSTCTTSICGPGILNSAKVITNVVYVDKTYAGTKEYGLPNVPYKTIGKANTAAWDRARTMVIEHGTYLFSNTLNITKTLTLIAISGTVTIGQ